MKSKIKNSSILITGANGGIGIETVKILLEKGAKRIVLACRTQEKADRTKALLNSHYKLEAKGGFDMQNKEAIVLAVSELPKNEKFDIVFFQAGGMVVSNDYQFIENTNGNRIEKTIYQNVMGSYITLKALLQQDLIATGGRIVFAGGEGARGIEGMIAKPEYDSVDDLIGAVFNGKGKYKDIDALGISKFMSGLLIQELAERDLNHEYVWFSPGLTAGTNGLVNVPPIKRFMFEKVGFPMMKLFGMAQGPKEAAMKYVECLDGKYGKTGDLIGAPEGKTLGNLVDQKPMNAGLSNHAFRKAFLQIAEQVA
ncbi:SDR family NAD(P)-dependent oxidoreductase [Flammeovirga kamogawensis]|uniref:SDR family NAD(P)-dependent oxidoreductase n=1 Tax=Flammeovirga kamogawensis TaxID=373891 RepID=A0ABX8H3L6_9BACT|nr:SDR family NAD(P)-dependent oxidoreductase [Flammeovirga kamogawensis]MBB6463748.1 NAD(P)-dependent dehydrogenase (short-subunit alcohol dehydrogenase family) [Flammeovirga kamogawensis]QWG09740.1 SDR family NAD(P)-dependent oxidoreductase [Flammeovirga kamogawensis]TRX65253.1 SDR family NAD(P)-dependent oxidoreductase [Flammeovirga kamogawensis]